MQNQNNGSAMRIVSLSLVLIVLPLSLGYGALPEVKDHRVEVKIDKRVIVVPPGPDVPYYAMLSIARHPDGTIFVNTQNEPLYSSSDNGKTWTAVPVKLPDAPPGQHLHVLHGFHISRDGRMWLMHQNSLADIFVSYSIDKGQTWKTTRIDWTELPPGGTQRPYNRCYNAIGERSAFIERPDGTMIVAIGVSRYPQNPEDLDPATGLVRPDAEIGGQMMLRSSDGGKTWGDATLGHKYMCEVSFAVNPNDPDHILAMTRVRRALLAGEDRQAIYQRTGCPANMDPKSTSVYKNGMLLESKDGGRSLFKEVPGGITGWYRHRGTILWAKNNVIVVNHQSNSGEVLARISLNGGKRWVDGTKAGAAFMNRSRSFVLVPSPPGHSFTSPSLELSPNHFLTVYWHLHPKKQTLMISGVLWHLEEISEK